MCVYRKLCFSELNPDFTEDAGLLTNRWFKVWRKKAILRFKLRKLLTSTVK